MPKRPTHEELEQRVEELEAMQCGRDMTARIFEEFTNASTEGLGIADLEGKITYANPALGRMLGGDPQEVVGTNVREYYLREDLPNLEKKVLAAVKMKKPQKVEMSLVSVHGKRTDAMQSLFLIHDEEGTPHYANVITDITDRKRAEDELKRQRNHLEELVEKRTTDLKLANAELEQEITERKQTQERLNRINSLREHLLSPGSLREKLKRITDGVVEIFDADFARVWITKHGDLCNSGCIHAKLTEGPHVCRFRDLCLHLMVSSGRYTHIDGETHRRVPFGCYKIGLIASGEDTRFVTNDVMHDQGVHDHEWATKLGLVSFAGYRLLSEEGKPIGVLALFSKHAISAEEDALLEGFANTTAEVIQTAKAEEALRESEERYRSLFENSRDAILLATKGGRYIDVNQAALDLFGYTRDEMMKTNAKDTYATPEDRERFLKAVAPKGYVQDYELRLRKKDGTVMDTITTTTLRHDDDGNVIGVQGIIRDITDRKRAQESLRKSSEAIKFFAYSVCHDLKNPAIAAYGLTKLLHKQYKDILDERGKSYCDQILRTSEQIAALVENINVYISTKEAPLTIEKVRMKEILQIAREEFSPQLHIRQVRWSEPERAVEMRADRVAVLRALRNLVDNSLKYGGDDLSHIEIGYEETDEFDVLSVRDDGVGMKKEVCERIFEAFKRDETSRGIEGAGLGLAIVKEIAERHGGQVWVESGQAKGITFYISISKYSL